MRDWQDASERRSRRAQQRAHRKAKKEFKKIQEILPKGCWFVQNHPKPHLETINRLVAYITINVCDGPVTRTIIYTSWFKSNMAFIGRFSTNAHTMLDCIDNTTVITDEDEIALLELGL